jgi:hypothetical protein
MGYYKDWPFPQGIRKADYGLDSFYKDKWQAYTKGQPQQSNRFFTISLT